MNLIKVCQPFRKVGGVINFFLFFFILSCCKTHKSGDLVKQCDTYTCSEGVFTDNMKQGVWKTFDKENRLIKIQNYKNNKLNGTSISFYDDGFVSSFGNYHDDKPHGPIILYFSDGLISNYDNYLYGIKEGFSYLYFRNGSLQSKWFYKNGKKDGEQIEFNEQKDTVRIDVFKNGILLRTEYK